MAENKAIKVLDLQHQREILWSEISVVFVQRRSYPRSFLPLVESGSCFGVNQNFSFEDQVDIYRYGMGLSEFLPM